MSKSNKISASFSEIDKEAVLVKIAEVKALMPFLIGLTVEERKNLRKMGPKSVDYVRQSLEGAKAFPDELKKSFDTVELEKDFTLINVNAKAMVDKISERFKGQGKKVNPTTI